MLTNLTVKNFQKHKKYRIDLDQITCITGPNDRGKTALFRSLYWLVKNRPSGSHFIREGSDFCKTKIEVDGRTITRSKGKNGNKYLLDGKVFSAVAGKVPEEISNVLNLDDINFQFQMEPVFWLTLSPGQLSKELNKIVNLDTIDYLTSILASEFRKKKTEKEIIECRLNEAKEKKQKLYWIKNADKKLQEIENLVTTISDLECRKTNLKNLICDLRSAKRKAKIKFPDLSNLTDLQEELQSLSIKKEDLSDLITKIKTTRELKWKTEESVQKKESQLKKIKKCPLCRTPTTLFV